jgi:hypothetical protein
MDTLSRLKLAESPTIGGSQGQVQMFMTDRVKKIPRRLGSAELSQE